MKKTTKDEYLEILKERKRTSRVYRDYQAVGLVLAEILEDLKHKALYIKLAKQYDSQILIGLARSVADRRGIRNKGAYFMRLLQKEPKNG